MSECTIAKPRVKFWLLSRSGSFAGVRFPLSEGVTRVGRAPDNHVVVEGDTVVLRFHPGADPTATADRDWLALARL